jgi:hypothetical protein
MENAPVIYLVGSNPPDASKEIQARYEKWASEVYFPLQLKTGKMISIDRYGILGEKPEYPKNLILNDFANLKSYEDWRTMPEVIAIRKDVDTTWPKYGREMLWGPVYQQLLSFKGNVTNFFQGYKREGEDLPVLNISAFNFSAVEWDRFNIWFGESGPRAFLPLFSKIPGLRQCAFYKWTGITRPGARIKEYPMFLMLSFFDSPDLSQYFEVCPEMAAFKTALKIGFPVGFAAQWNVRYQLINSFRI